MNGMRMRYRTQARVLWDDEALYVAFVCEDDEPWARPGRQDDDAIYEDEVVEIFLDAGGVGRDYVEIEVSPANVHFDARFDHWRSDLEQAKTFRSEIRSAVTIDGQLTVGDATPAPARGWTAEFAVPWRALALHPRSGERWRMNLYRLETHNHEGVQEGSAFSPPMRGDFHALDRFGFLVFDK